MIMIGELVGYVIALREYYKSSRYSELAASKYINAVE